MCRKYVYILNIYSFFLSLSLSPRLPQSALLEEQQQVMQRCAEERRKLAAEWTQFHTQEKLRQERAEREASRALERDAHREGSIISFAQVLYSALQLYSMCRSNWL